MGNTTSQQGSQARGVQSPGRASSTARTSSPGGRTRSPLGPHRSLKTKKKSLELPDLASLAQLYAGDLAHFRDLSGLDVDAWPTVRILSGRMSPADLAERFAARVEVRPSADAVKAG